MRAIEKLIKSVVSTDEGAFLAIQTDTQDIIGKMVEGTSQLQKEVILQSLWDIIARAGYYECLCVITRNLEPNEEELHKLASSLGKSRPSLVYTFCKEFNIDPTVHIEKLIKRFKDEEAEGVTFNSNRFLRELERELSELHPTT